jgi:hypothetical membrane protein
MYPRKAFKKMDLNIILVQRQTPLVFLPKNIGTCWVEWLVVAKLTLAAAGIYKQLHCLHVFVCIYLYKTVTFVFGIET